MDTRKVTTTELFQFIGEQQVEIRILRDALLVARRQAGQDAQEIAALREQNAAMAAQIGADHGEPA